MNCSNRLLWPILLGLFACAFVLPASALSPLEAKFETSATFNYNSYAKLLAKYVTADGVLYEKWYANPVDLSELEVFLSSMATVDVKAMSPDEQKAFYINLYNAGMLQAVFRNYPLKSVKRIGLIPFSIFKKDLIQLGDQKLSLDDIEKGILLKEFFDPRIHFAVNCASESCPPLRVEPYNALQLEAQLEEQTRLFAESDRAVRENGKRYAYSELFNWYGDDFIGKHPAKYLNQYRSEPLPTQGEFDWIPYDWSLNTAK